MVLVCVLVSVLVSVLVELGPQQGPWAQGGAWPLGALHQKPRVQLLPEQLLIYERKERETERHVGRGLPRGEADSHLALAASAGQAAGAACQVRAGGWREERSL